ncbi:MAG: hypothetical protein MPL62_02715 [Alphaproteobacteria bacterium]|nr:hypothetical protein [Alphaproteobacteria bacterium]
METGEMTELRIRKFNGRGMEHFMQILSERGDAREPFDSSVLENGDLTESVSFEASVDVSRNFSTRYELGQYIASILPDGASQNLKGEYGLWAWLTYAMMDILSPVGKPLGEVSRYVPSESFGRVGLSHRHLIRSAVDVFTGDHDEEFKKLALSVSPDVMGYFHDHCYGNPRIRRSIKTQQVIVALYGDGKGGLKRGFADYPRRGDTSGDRGKGGLRRFVENIVPRLHENYDIDRMELKDFIEVWGDEIKTSQFYDESLLS